MTTYSSIIPRRSML